MRQRGNDAADLKNVSSNAVPAPISNVEAFDILPRTSIRRVEAAGCAGFLIGARGEESLEAGRSLPSR